MFKYNKILLQDNTLWVAFFQLSLPNSSVGLVQIDLKEKKVSHIWYCGCPGVKKTRVELEFYKPLSGIAVTDDNCFIALKDIGLVNFPRKIAQKYVYYNKPRIMTEKDDIPSIALTGLASVNNKLWIAYGDAGRESGIIIFDPNNKKIETVFCSTIKGDTPFEKGNPYQITELTPGPDNKMFFSINGEMLGISGEKEKWPGLSEIAGFWKIDTSSKKLQFLWQDKYLTRWPAEIDNQGGNWWLRNNWILAKFDPNSEVATFIFGGLPTMNQVPILQVKEESFTPDGYSYQNFGTAAIYQDKFWARFGQSQIIITEKGKGKEAAKIIDNNILNGEGALKFFSTPYGLVAVGEGSIGIVNTESIDEKKE